MLWSVFAACTLTAGLTGSLARAEGPPSAAPNLAQREVTSLVQQAQQSGTVEAVEAVSSSSDSAQALLDPQAKLTSAPALPVDVVVMHGHFAETLSAPPGKAAPTGSVMALTVDAATGKVAAIYVGDRSPALSTLGAVERMTPVTAAATASRATHRTFRRGPGRRIARAAVWGNGCRRLPNNEHCYAIASWAMTGGEQVEGTESEQRTTNMNVPGWASGDMVNNEEWASFPGTGHWVEIGQKAGAYKSCCNLFWFYAFNGPSGYYEYNGPPYTWEVTPNTFNNYAMKSIGNGVWCFDVGPTWEQQVACDGGFQTYSKELQDGLEVAAESKPVNAGTVVVNATWTNGTIHTWNRAEDESTTPGLCWSHFQPYPGNINYGTC